MEVWKDIKGYEGIYQASNTGKLRSLDRMKKTIGANKSGRYPVEYLIKGKILVGGKDKDGYIIGVFRDHGGNKRMKKFHRLIAQTFLPNPLNLPQVNHINGIKNDNRIENLEWVSAKRNANHSIETGLRTHDGLKKKVARLDPITLEVLEVYESAMSTKHKGFNRCCVGECCRGQRDMHKGYRWKFVD